MSIALHSVMAGHSRSKNGVASLAYVPAIPTRRAPCLPKRDARLKPAHDDQRNPASDEMPGALP